MKVKQYTDGHHCFFDIIGTRWISKFIHLAVYALFLLPGFIQGEMFILPSNPALDLAYVYDVHMWDLTQIEI